MRLEHLLLKRYGRFTDQALDFTKAPGTPDLHIVFGPNEAGKSTLRSAVVDLLYGFPSRTSYDFLHDKSTLQLDATVSTSESRYALSRIKRAKNSLLGPDGQVLAESQMAGLLGGLSRDGYLNMFSVDEDLLEEGSESILRSEGDLGELLFSSAAGLSALSAELSTLREEAEAFYKRPGRVFELAELKKQLAALKAEIKATDIPASQFEALRKKLAALDTAHQQAVDERDAHNAERFRLQALLDCEPLYREATALREALAEQPPSEAVPDGWAAEAQTLAIELSNGAGKIDQLRKNLQGLQSELDTLQADPEALAVGARLDRLVQDDLEADYRAGARTEELNGLLHGLEVEISAGLARLGLDPSIDRNSLTISAVQRARIKPLLEKQALLEADLGTAQTELDRAEALVAQARREHEAVVEWGDYVGLGECLEDARVLGDDRELNRLKKDAEQAQVTVDRALKALEGWPGSADELMHLTVPAPETLEALAEGYQDNQQRERLLRDNVERLQLELAQLNAQLGGDEMAGPTDSDVGQALRAQREVAWQAHRASLDREQSSRAELRASADAFRQALDNDDRSELQRIELAEKRGAASETLASRAAKTNELEVTRNQQNELERTLESLDQSRQSILQRLDVSQDWTIKQLQGWLLRRTAVLRELHQLHDVQRQLKSAEAQVTQAREQLWNAMRGHALEPSAQSFAHDVVRVEEQIRRWQDSEQTHLATKNSLDQSELALADRQRQVANTTAALAAWRSEWTDALSGLSVLGERSVAEPEEMSEILAVLDALAPQFAKASDTKAQIVRWAAAKERYQVEVRSIAEQLGMSSDTDDPLQLADQMRSRLQTARRSEQRRLDKEAAKDSVEAALAQAEAELESRTTRVEEMMTRFPASTVSDLLDALKRAEQRTANERRLNQLNEQIKDRLANPDLDSAMQLLTEEFSQSGSADKLRLAYDAQSQATDDSNKLVSTRFHEWQEARTVLAGIGDDGEVARLNEQVRVLLLEIQQKSQRFISLSAGTQAVERALRVYMDTHRSSMLHRASASFATITGGAFSGLEAMPAAGSKSGDELVGLRANGSSLPAKAMSKGSRFQLYLSLRIAGYHEFVAQRDPLPFFADDILETFDDRRSKATFGLMAEMSRHGQVIYLTHHRHLCDLALAVTDGQATIHELPGPLARPA